MTIAPPGSGEATYRVIEHEGFAEVELLASRFPEELGEALIGEAAGRRWSCLLLDCTRLRFVSSLGLGALIRLDRMLRPTGGRLRLCGLDPHLRELLAITRIDRVLQVCEDREAGRSMDW